MDTTDDWLMISEVNRLYPIYWGFSQSMNRECLSTSRKGRQRVLGTAQTLVINPHKLVYNPYNCGYMIHLQLELHFQLLLGYI